MADEILFGRGFWRRSLSQAFGGAGHEVLTCPAAGLLGRHDALQLSHAILTQRVLLTKNYDDFGALHELVLACGGHHPGILVVRSDNDSARDMSLRGVALAIKKLIASDLPVVDDYIILNQWR